MFESNKYFQSSLKKSSYLNSNHRIEREKNKDNKSAPKTTRLLLAQLINSFIEYTSELTHFSINAFQTSSLKRVQISTLTRFDNYCLPRICTFHYSLDREFDEFIQQMKKLCKRTQNTFLDIRLARIHYPQSSMYNIQDTYRLLNILKCNIERLRDLKQIHQNIGYDLLLPNDQLFLSLDLLVTNFQLILCELDNRVRFKDAIILQTLVKDIFLLFRVVLTWLYPAIKMAAYRNEEPNKQFTVKRCENFNKKLQFLINPNSIIKPTQDRSQSALQNDQNNEQKQLDERSSSIIIDQFMNEERELVDQSQQNSISNSNNYSTTLSFIKRPSISSQDKETNEQDLLIDKDKIWYKNKFDKIQQKLRMDSGRTFIS